MRRLSVAIQPLPEVFLDESGNTGPDLGNLDQPLYSLASVLGGPDWDDIVESSPRSELKWSSLASTPQGRNKILEIAEKAAPSLVKTAIADKRYMAVAKMVDELIEPLATETGFDFYGTESHIGQTKILYVALRGLAGERWLNQAVAMFVRMMRQRTEDSVNDFYRLIEKISRQSDELNRELEILLITEGYARAEILGAPGGLYELDPSVPFVVSLSQSWTAELQVPHRFVHDNAATLERWKPLLERLASLETEPRTFLIGEKRIMLPSLTLELTFADSASSPLIQIADVLAGATRYLAQGAMTGIRTQLWDRIQGTSLEDCLAETLIFTPPDA
jgi:hypothetical protein